MIVRFSVYVQSNTLMGDSNHPTGVVLAEIVKANIPVRNGVVHLIQRPLMVVDTTVRDFLEVSARSSVINRIYERCSKTASVAPIQFSVTSIHSTFTNSRLAFFNQKYRINPVDLFEEFFRDKIYRQAVISAR